MTLLTDKEITNILETGGTIGDYCDAIARAQLRKVIAEIEEIYRLNCNLYGPFAGAFTSGILVWKEAAKKEIE